MSRSHLRLRLALSAVVLAGSLSLGAGQASASRGAWPPPATCTPRDYEYVTPVCNAYCYGPGFCNTFGYCQCGPLP
ncbi:MAG TPA: hypothetical protein VF615_16330 [Longimicrobiaceae bacterium]|jgi:hypothetical protein